MLHSGACRSEAGAGPRGLPSNKEEGRPGWQGRDVYRRGQIYYIAYRWDGREYRESARSSDREVAERLLATRLGERRGSAPSAALTFDALAAWYLDDYGVRQLRTLDTARGRVANLRAVFGGWPATTITTEAIRSYQRRRRAAGAAAATVNRETSALSRMFQLAVRGRQLRERPVFPERLEENGPRQGFFEHAEYTAVRQYLPAPYQDVLDFAYYSGWRKREILGLGWDEVDEGGGVVRLSPARSKTRVGRVLPISPPIEAVLSRRRVQRRAGDPRVFTRDATTVRVWRTAWPAACRQAGVPGRLLHDCRRTAARNLVRAGVPERVAMQLTGHTTRAIFDRYCIVNESRPASGGGAAGGVSAGGPVLNQTAARVRRDGETRALELWPGAVCPPPLARWAARARSSGACVRAVDRATYRALRSNPTWGLVMQLLVTTQGQIRLHWLWLLSHRKDLIARKLARRRAGRRVGHLRHHPQSELSDAELRGHPMVVGGIDVGACREEHGDQVSGASCPVC